MFSSLANFFRRKPSPRSFAAQIDPSATIHSTAEIHNLRGDPELLRIKEHSHVRGELLLFSDGGEIEIGKWNYIGPSSRIWSRHKIVIGTHVLISHLVDIHDTDGHPENWRQRRADTERILGAKRPAAIGEIAGSPITIEDDVWIGCKATILKGVTIGRGAIIAAGSVVTSDVPPFTLVAGVPARPVRQLEPDEPNTTQIA